MPSMSAQSDPVSFAARYYDGRQAVAHNVSVQISGTALILISENGSVLDTWALTDLELGDRSKDWVRVAKKGSEARLSLNDPRAFDVLLALAPNIMTRQKRLRRGMLLAVVSTIAVIAGVYFAIPVITKGIVAIVPPSVEVRLGDGSSKAIVDMVASAKDKPLCDKPQGSTALGRMTDTLANHTDGSFPYRVKVLNVDMSNAIALPGGHIFLFKGLLEKAETPEEIAGVLAHEMAHVDLRHSLHGLVHQAGLGVLSDMMFGGSSMGSLSGFVVGASYTREAEAAADEQAVRTLRDAGISTQGFAAFFERLHSQEAKAGFGLPAFMSTHPPSDKRAKLAQSALPSRIELLSPTQWKDFQSICE
ncbi:M48 family metallopeptidase [Magnetovibrio sp. PR-2]|uniref:M48 family metallopeptidase n=1 Tax=Magnetovibrio sp. PR-2 TaxID=3120356 RepID=UPI002FCE6571